jgi:cell division protein FtsB
MRWLAVIFVLLIVGLQYPLWLGKGGWLKVRELDAQVAAQRQTNVELKARNEALDAEVRDLKHGVAAIEERARSDLGMIRHDEVFFQLPPGEPSAEASSPRKPGPTDAQDKASGSPLTRE